MLVQSMLLALVILAAAPAASPRGAMVVLAPANRHALQSNLPCVDKATLHRNGTVKHCRLASEHRFGVQLLPAGSDVYLLETGVPERIVLGAGAAFNGQVLPAKATVFLERDGRLRSFWLPEDAVIQGHRIPGQEDRRGNRLHPNGTVRAVWLVGDQEIDGIPCTTSGNVFRMGLRVIRLGSRRMAWFYDNGRLQQAMLSRDAVILGHAFKKGDIISLRRDGTVDLAAPKLG